ncbi:hypothetical protein [Anaerosporobacter faecicola]|uniref:hypothetical protein n=1 Tax=Anaerosporobacter faecicola TaxID=2718714 RepID=UPI00143C248B|nr:hypothetical protein [Anaerosporobacter faecicola]
MITVITHIEVNEFTCVYRVNKCNREFDLINKRNEFSKKFFHVYRDLSCMEDST